MSTVVTSAAPLLPPLKWAGGKRWQLPLLRPFWEPHRHRRLVEPFCGGLAVALGLRPVRALLNDANPHLISFYRWLQRGLRIEIEMANDKAIKDFFATMQQPTVIVTTPGRLPTPKTVNRCPSGSHWLW